jgi:hypothetical protein
MELGTFTTSGFAAYVNIGGWREKQQLNGFFANVKYLISRTDFLPYEIHLDVCSRSLQVPPASSQLSMFMMVKCR